MSVDVDQLMSDPNAIDTMSSDELNSALSALEKVQDNYAPKPKETPVVEQKEMPEVELEEEREVPESKTDKSKEKPKSLKDKVAELKKERYEQQDQINRLKMQLKRYEDARQPDPHKIIGTDGKSVGDSRLIKSSADEYWSDDHQLNVALELDRQRQELRELRAEREAVAAQRKQDDIFSEAQELADKNGLGISVKTADAAYKMLGSKHNRVPTQAELAEEIGEYESEAYLDIVKAFQAKQADGYKRAASAWTDLDLREKWAERARGNRQNTQSDETPSWMAAQKSAVQADMRKAQARTPTLPSTYQGTGSVLTKEYAMQWLSRNPDPSRWSPTDKKTFDTIQTKFL